jgi:hypothetical protein
VCVCVCVCMYLPDGVYVPLGNSGARQSAVCVLPLKHAFCLSTYDKVLYVCMNAAVGFCIYVCTRYLCIWVCMYAVCAPPLKHVYI